MSRTPGLWRYGKMVDGTIVIQAPTNCLIAQLPKTLSGVEFYDAQLISAAPDLLVALKYMLSGWHYIREAHGDLYGVGWDSAQNLAEMAVKKAEGDC